MKLISVDAAAHTALDGVLTLVITADLDDGAGPQSLPYGWIVGDPHGLGPQVDAWMAAHPDFPIAAYVAPVIPPAQIDDETNRRMTAATADAMMRLQVLGTPIPDAVKTAAQAIDARGTALKAMGPIPADYADDKYWS
jgi:hypothetical protein